MSILFIELDIFTDFNRYKQPILQFLTQKKVIQM